MDKQSYWTECIAIAAEECGAKLTQEQIEYIGGAAEGGHENYGQAFDSPPAGDRISDIERECKAKIKAAQAEADRVRSDFVANVCMRRNCQPHDVILEGGGHVTIQR
jgi:hypothetical protein